MSVDVFINNLAENEFKYFTKIHLEKYAIRGILQVLPKNDTSCFLYMYTTASFLGEAV